MLPAAAPPVPLYRSFGRWFVACDNTRSCEARGFDEVTRADLRVRRAAGPAPAILVLAADTALDRDALRLDGVALDLGRPAWTTVSQSQSEWPGLSISNPRAVAAFVAAASPAHALTLDPDPSPSDDRPWRIPLDGFKAALLLIDAVQGRPGTPTALIAATGPNPVPSAPPLPAAPRWVRPTPLTDAESRRVIARAARLRPPDDDSCSVSDPASVDALDATHAIAIRPCHRAAYQASSLVEIFPRRGGEPAPVSLPVPALPPGGDGPEMTEPSFDLQTGQLAVTAKGRGLADCGFSATWTWSGGAFRLISLVYQDACGGAGPGDWPVLFRTRP